MTTESKGRMSVEQVEAYRRAIAPLQESLAATKAARQEVFKWIKRNTTAPMVAQGFDEPNAGCA